MALLESVETALITGASRGIGEAFARRLAALGKDLILVARSESKLQALASELVAAHGVAAQVIVADLSRSGSAVSLFRETERRGLTVDLLVNNAGFSRVGEFAEIPCDVQADMVRLNVNALMELTRLYLPAMRRGRRGGVINVASNAAFQSVPYMSVYAASKAFVLHFSEGLAREVAADGVRVLALCPGATATEFWTIAGALEDRREMMTSPDKVVTVALRAFDRGRAFVVPGLGYKLLAFASSRLAPRWLVTAIAGRLFR
ncbi:MAG: SDR family oxidoreductase [Anaerolineae bacterium]